MSGKRRLRDLPSWQRRLVGAGAVVQVSLLGATLLDIRRRPAEEIRGPKRLWCALSFVNFVGPVSYFLLGRRRHRPAQSAGE